MRIKYSSAAHKQMKLLMKRNYDMQKFKDAVNILQNDLPIPQKYDKHPLSGKLRGCFSLSLAPDWRLIYYIEDDCIHIYKTGTHSDIYD
jgi:mRNA interferase YafQ